MSGPPAAQRSPAAVILDLDGTLVDTVDTRIHAWLDVFAEEGIPAAREQVASSVEALNLLRAPLIVDGTHVANAKPAPDLLLLAASRLGADPSRCWYVGDATPDMLAAVAAGMVAIGVTSGAVDEAALRLAGAERVVASLADLAI